MSRTVWIIIILVALAMFIGSGINTIPTLEEKVNASWAEVQNQYQRRSDLIPNLVSTVKGYAMHEQDTLVDVINARANATKVNITADQLSDPQAVKNYEAAQGQLTGALSRLMVVAEKYPDLKANENFLALQSQLEGTENRIAIARQDFLGTVQVYNTTVRTFPGVFWAHIYGAKPKAEYTATTQGADVAPVVKF